jgi:beta-lactam-binding protein with PASTA domain
LSVLSRSFSAIGKLIFVGVLLTAFLGGMTGVVYMSLSGQEVKVPDLVGKDFVESEKELASLGLKIKKRADRPSPDKINTVLEQLPKPGDTVKTGQMILVVVSKLGSDGEVAPPTLKKDSEEEDAEKIEEMISDKPKKKANSNTNKKKADTTRDVISNTSTSNSNDSKETDDSDKKDSGDKKSDSDKGDKGDKKEPAPKTQSSPNSPRVIITKPSLDGPKSRPR